MRINVADANPQQLNYLVALAEGYDCQFDDDVSGPWLVPQEGYLHDEKPLSSFSPVTDWAKGGRIVEQNGINLTYDPFVKRWSAICEGGDSYHAITPLIAAMMCFVASQVGEEVEVPDELAFLVVKTDDL